MGALLALLLLVALASGGKAAADPPEIQVSTDRALNEIETKQIERYKGVIGPRPDEMWQLDVGPERAGAGVGVAPPPQLMAVPIPITAIIEPPAISELQESQPMPARGNVDVKRARLLAADASRDVEVYEGFYAPELMAEFQAAAGLFSDHIFATTGEYRADGRYGGRTREALKYFGVSDPPPPFYGPFNPPPYVLPGIGGFLS